MKLIRSLLVASLAAVAGAMHVGGPGPSTRARLIQLRGGQDGGEDDAADNRRLGREEVETKLSSIPVFCILNEEAQFIGMSADDGAIEVAFYVEHEDATEAFELMKAASEDLAADMRLGVLPLSAAFKICGGWESTERPTEPPTQEEGQPRYILRGPRQAAEEHEATVREQLVNMGLTSAAASKWVVPVFCTDDFQRPDMMPLFFSEEQLKQGWVRAGLNPDDVELVIPTVMDVRALVMNMMNTDQMPWSRFQLVTSVEAYEASQKLQAEAAADDGESESEEPEEGESQ
jgi:hypothetical protein|tara:strand:- start:485 stop:1351 length:867 start_codon:yes stop_codon:yes gene_type:complete